MDSYMPLLMVTLCACTCGEPLPAALQRRSDGGPYARHHARGYKPFAFAAISLHAPIPMLHVMSRAPLTPDAHDARAAASGVVPAYAQPLYAADSNPQPYSSQAYAAGTNTPPYSTHVFALGAHPQQYNPQVYPAGANAHPYNSLVYPAGANARPYNPPSKYASSVNDIISDSSTESDEPIVLYARPNPQGGYSYRRRPAKKRAPAPTPRPAPEPVIIRVQKYRVIRDR
ncbi:hypothetical protein evm_011555 [Chilo suppressalis]|nr:hypothetical protein evm_011555 [Chilo suppressalis]